MYILPPFLVNAFLSTGSSAIIPTYTPSLPFEVRCESDIYVIVIPRARVLCGPRARVYISGKAQVPMV